MLMFLDTADIAIVHDSFYVKLLGILLACRRDVDDVLATGQAAVAEGDGGAVGPWGAAVDVALGAGQ